jgi:choline dehydrogenase
MEHASFGPARWRGGGGLLHLSDVSGDAHPLCEAFPSACVQRDLERSSGLDGATQEGWEIDEIKARGAYRPCAPVCSR